jgi:hypothetical protein
MTLSQEFAKTDVCFRDCIVAVAALESNVSTAPPIPHRQSRRLTGRHQPRA